MSKISVVIVNYNTCGLLLDCLRSIYDDIDRIDTEIWVVDNASKDGSSEAVRLKFPKVRLIENQTNLGFSRANNQALCQSDGDICILLNPDTVVIPGFFSQILAGFQINPQAGLIAPQLLNADHSIQPSWGQFSSAWTEFFFQLFLYKIFPSPIPIGRKIHRLQRIAYETVHEVPWATGACLAFRRKMIEKAGLLDESIFMYGEDVEWAWRIHKNGEKILFFPAAKIIHFAQRSSKLDFAGWITNYTRGQLKFIQRHRSQGSARLASLFVMIGSSLRIIIWAIIKLFYRDNGQEAPQRIEGYLKAFQIGWQGIKGTFL
jgi:GT2 family glycosyltransferase